MEVVLSRRRFKCPFQKDQGVVYCNEILISGEPRVVYRVQFNCCNTNVTVLIFHVYYNSMVVFLRSFSTFGLLEALAVLHVCSVDFISAGIYRLREQLVFNNLHLNVLLIAREREHLPFGTGQGCGSFSHWTVCLTEHS